MSKDLVVLGGGISGLGTAVLAKKKGLDVFLSDIGLISADYKSILSTNNIEWEEKKHSEELILEAKEIMKSPGIPDNLSLIQEIRNRNIPIISEIELDRKSVV